MTEDAHKVEPVELDSLIGVPGPLMTPPRPSDHIERLEALGGLADMDEERQRLQAAKVRSLNAECEELTAQVRRLKDALMRLAGCDHAQVDHIAENDYDPAQRDGCPSPKSEG